MAKGAIEAAIWDAEAKQKGIPLRKLLGGVREEIPCGVSIGIKETLDDLVAMVERELTPPERYQRIKNQKLSLGRISNRSERLCAREFPQGVRMMVDANSAYHLRRLAAP